MSPELVMTVDGNTLMASFQGLSFNTQYTCCVEVGYTDSSGNSSSCATGSTELPGQGGMDYIKFHVIDLSISV